jgi:hypothetical protein
VHAKAAQMLKTRAGQVIGSQVELDDRDVLLTRPEAAKYLKRTEATLERWARLGIGPKPVKIGQRGVRYTLRSLREHIEAA